MGRYCIFQEHVYYADASGCGCVPLEVFLAPAFVKEASAHVLLGGVAFQKLKVPDAPLKRQGAFPPVDRGEGVLTRHERLAADTYQAMSVPASFVRRIYNAFKPGSVKTCVPYALSIRAFLLARGCAGNGAWSVLDQAEGRFFLTLVYGHEVAETRELPFIEPERVLDEVRRSEKSFLDRHEGMLKFRLVSNSRDMTDAAARLRAYSLDDITTVDAPFLGFEALEKAKFSVHFSLTDPVPRPAMKAVVFGCLIAFAAMAIGGYSLLRLDAAHRDAVLRAAQYAEAAQVRQEFRARMRATYQDQIRHLFKPRYGDDLGGFISGLPFGWHSVSLTWSHDPAGVVLTAVASAEHAGVCDFQKNTDFKNAQVAQSVAQGRPAVRVTLCRHERAPVIPEEGSPEALKARLAALQGFKTGLQQALRDAYQRLADDIYALARSQRASCLIDAGDAADGKDMFAQAPPSITWDGLKELSLKITCSHIRHRAMLASILAGFSAIERAQPLCVKKVSQEKEALVIDAVLVGP
ncbi:MAG: hypothetical protein HQL19_07715 [Candidatus Omnitrophica bacterium]|nr:hypothetical protein [Candidatus Omnitrophota bacterium]